MRWIYTDKGTKEKPNIRCRLVARDFKTKGSLKEDLFAAMPPLEAKKVIMTMCAARWRKWTRGEVDSLWKIMFIDVKKAHTYATCDDDGAYIQLPPEDFEEGKCGKLKRWLYGMRNAASAWEKDFTENLRELGMKAGISSSVVFCDAARQVRCVVRGDDFTFLGWGEEPLRIRHKGGHEHFMNCWCGGSSAKTSGTIGKSPS